MIDVFMLVVDVLVFAVGLVKDILSAVKRW